MILLEVIPDDPSDTPAEVCGKCYFLDEPCAGVDCDGVHYVEAPNVQAAVYAAFEKVGLPTRLPDKVIFSDPATILITGVGGKYVVKCSEDDNYSREYGYLLCKFLQNTGKTRTQVSKELHRAAGSCERGYEQRFGLFYGYLLASYLHHGGTLAQLKEVCNG